MVIVIDDFAVDSNTVQQTKAPVIPPVTPLYDDNTMYNATVYPGQQVSAPSAAVQPVVYQAPIWESATQTYRDPASGRLWLDDGTPDGQWVSDTAYAATKVHPAPPPPVSSEDDYDLYHSLITDADAYWQMYNPGKVEDLTTQWQWDYEGAKPIYGQVDMEERDREYYSKVKEMSEAGLIEPSTAFAFGGETYNYPYQTRSHWNQKNLAELKDYYTPEAFDRFSSSVPAYVGSNVSYNPPSLEEDTGGGFAGYYSGDQVFFRSPAIFSVYPHERAHQWDLARPEAYTENPAFDAALQMAKEDPSVPQWVKNAIASGEHREASGTGRRLTETYAHIAEVAMGRLAEIPPYLRVFFDTLYSESVAPPLTFGTSRGMNFTPAP